MSKEFCGSRTTASGRDVELAVKIVLALWNAAPSVLTEGAGESLGATAVVTSIAEAVLQAADLAGDAVAEGFMEAPTPADDRARVVALRSSGALDPRAKPLFDVAAKRAADIFDVPMALVSLMDEHAQDVRGAFGGLKAANDTPASARTEAEQLNVLRELSICGHVVAIAKTLVVPDIARDLRFARNPVLRDKGLHFYAGAPLRDNDGRVLGTLCLLDSEPRNLSKREVGLLETMAQELMDELRDSVMEWDGLPTSPPPIDISPPSSVVGQLLPS